MAAETALGRVPQQPRARATVARILAAASDILVEEGLAGLNTNAIAERAGVNISTLYRYFPDKYAVLVHLFDAFEAQRADHVVRRIHELESGAAWRPWLASVISDLARMRTEDSSGVALRRAMASSGELVEHDRASAARITAYLAATLRGLGPSLSEKRATAVAALVVDVITVGLDNAFETTPPDLDRVTELETMVDAYLSTVLHD